MCGIGISIIASWKESRPFNAKHFQSVHSWLGLLAIILVVVQSGTGIFKYCNLPRLTVHSHGLVGLAAWIIAMFAVLVGVSDFKVRFGEARE